MSGATAKASGGARQRQAYLRAASQRFTDAWNIVEAQVREAFPDAEPAFLNGLPGWRLPLPEDAEPPAGWGTMPPHAAWVLVADRKAGPVLHLWNPMDYYWLDAHRDQMAAHGLKVMRGCVQYARKAPYPEQAVAGLLRAMAEDLDR